MEEASTEAIVDTGATGDFVDQDSIATARLLTCKLSEPIPVYNVDRTPNEARSIHEIVDVLMTYYGHSKHILLAVTRLGKQSMILSFTLLDKHNCNVRAESFAERDDEARSEAEGETRARMGTLPRCDLVREIAVLNKNKMGRGARSDTNEARSGNGRKILDILTASPRWWGGSI